MKKLTLTVLLLLLSIMLFGCSDEYEPVESTEEEAQVVLTVTADGDEYEIKYELYRALFLANRDAVDGGDLSVWSGDGKDAYIEKINKIILSKAAEIFGTIHTAEELGFKPYSNAVEEKISEKVKGAVEGDDLQVGHGSYEEYLASLKESYLNYSVAALLMRYSLALEHINEYYVGTTDVLGASSAEYEYTEDDVREYYFGNDSARVLVAYFPKGVRTYAYVESFRQSLIALNSDYERAAYILGNTAATASDLIITDGEADRISGTVVGKHTLPSDYSEYTEAIFALKAGEMSSIIELDGTDADGYYIVYRIAEDEGHFELCYDTIEVSYLDAVVGDAIYESISEMISSVEYEDAYSNINHDGISMD